MKKRYIYQEIIMSKNISFIDQLNEQGANGWEFITQAQKVSNTGLTLNNQPNIIITMIFKKEVFELSEIKN